VAGLRYRRRWSSLARAFGLPPPCRTQRRRFAVDALLARPVAGTLEVVALLRPGLSEAERAGVTERLEAIQQILSSAGAPVRALALDLDRLGRDPEIAHLGMAFGALLAGRLSPAAWERFEQARRPLQAIATSVLAGNAPTPIATLALTLMARGPCPPPLDAALALLTGGLTPRRLADPETFCARWAGLVPGLGPLLQEALTFSRATGRPAPGELERILEHGRRLALACACAVRSSRLGRANRFTQALWR
jgi:hypothetical protein